MSETRIHLAKPSFSKEELEAVQRVLESGWVTQGPEVEAFEEDFSQVVNLPHCIAVSSGTSALYLSLLAMGIGPGDEVIVPSFTWVATANAVSLCGAKPVFADVSLTSYNLDPTSMAQAITNKTKAIIAVHQFGLMADMDEILKQAKDIPVIEDAACALGSRYKGKAPGHFGKLATFSFHPRKIITTGEGGMIATQDSKLADLLRSLRNHGAAIPPPLAKEKDPRFAFDRVGTNSRMSDVLAAIGKIQLSKLSSFINKRTELADQYHKAIKDIPWLTCPSFQENNLPNYQSFTCHIDDTKIQRSTVIKHLLERGIESHPASHAVHLLEAHQGFPNGSFQNADFLHKAALALPIHDGLWKDDIEIICQTLQYFDTGN